jgi:hypothetical protein
LQPPRSLQTLSSGKKSLLIQALKRLFDADTPALRAVIPDLIEHFGKVQITGGGDLIHAAELITTQTDGRDATHIRVGHAQYQLCCT